MEDTQIWGCERAVARSHPQIWDFITEPVRISFHLVGEFATAACLTAGGIALLRGKTWARSVSLFAAGMLAYPAVVSPGYFAQQGQFPLVGMFAVLLALNIVNAVILLRSPSGTSRQSW